MVPTSSGFCVISSGVLSLTKVSQSFDSCLPTTLLLCTAYSQQRSAVDLVTEAEAVSSKKANESNKTGDTEMMVMNDGFTGRRRNVGKGERTNERKQSKKERRLK